MGTFSEMVGIEKSLISSWIQDKDDILRKVPEFSKVKEEINQNLSKEEIQSYNSLDSFAVKEEMNENLSNEEIQSYNCYLCDASFFQQKFLKFHFAYDHEGQNPWKCKIC